MCMSLNSWSPIVGKKQFSLVNEHLKAIHEAFHVEIYMKLKPTGRKITYLLYIFNNLRVL